MSDFEETDLRGKKPRQNRALYVRADVAGQQERDLAIHDLQDHRIVVADSLTFPVRQAWMQDENASVAEAELFTLVPPLEYGAGRHGAPQYGLQRGCARNPYSLPHMPRLEIVNQR